MYHTKAMKVLDHVDNKYLELQVANIQNNQKPPPLQINVSEQSAFLQDPSQYDMSIIRFTLNTSFAPVFIPTIEPNQNDISKTIYTVQLSLNNVFSDPIHVAWDPQNKSVAEPTPPDSTYNKLQDNQLGYYACSSFNYFAILVSQAFITALADLSSKTTVDPDVIAPLLYFSQTGDKQMKLQVQREFYDIGSVLPADVIRIYVNEPLYDLMDTMPAFFLGYNVNEGYTLLPFGLDGVNVKTVSGNEVITLTQETDTLSNYNPYTSLVFTTSSLPIIPSRVVTPLLFSNGQLVQTNTNGSTDQLIITDLVASENYRGEIIYTPTAEYRKISLTGSQSLNILNINAYYRSKLGTLIPVRLTAGGTCSILFVFTKRE